MEVRVLGCYGGEMPGHRTTCLMINHNLLIDAGAATSALTIEEQTKIDAIVISHSHLDHIRDLGFLADNIFGQRPNPVRIFGLPETIAHIKAHVLNNQVWPDFSQLPTPENSVITFNHLDENQTLELEGLTFTACRVNHTVPAAGFIVGNQSHAFAYSGDTGPTQAIWDRVNQDTRVSAIFIEVSFPNRLAQLAEVSGHLTPASAKREIEKLDNKDIAIYVFHMKPQFVKEIGAELKELDTRIRPLQQGDRIAF